MQNVVAFSEYMNFKWKVQESMSTAVHTVKSKVKISQNVVAFSEYMNFINKSADLAENTCGTTNHLVLIQ